MAATPGAALVTGGARGIGFVCAEALAKAGYGLTLLARTPATLDDAVRQGRGEAAHAHTRAQLGWSARRMPVP
jgi:NAD(P)-dependent dehydrogenase (short-subunit alcohol dehydrogenase family)